MLTPSRAQELIAAFAGQPVLVVGDVMLDQFLVGRVDRISPEAPVPVVAFDHDDYRIGGAANAAHNLRTLGAEVELVGVVGTDAAGVQLLNDVRARGIAVSGVISSDDRPTTRKLRIVTMRNQQVARVDYEIDVEVTGELEERLFGAVERGASTARAIVVSDYLKGAVTRRLMQRVITSGTSRNIPVLVDPKIPHLAYYAGATLITPNHYEAEQATHARIRTDEEAEHAAMAFRSQTQCQSVLITRGEHGMCLLDGGAPQAASTRVHHLPAAAREVADVTGAGDTVVATLAVALAAGARTVEAAALANLAAGIVVGKFGPATLTPEELLTASTRSSV